MKLIRYGKLGLEKPGLEIKGVRYDVSNLVSDYDEYFFESIPQFSKTFGSTIPQPIISK